MRHYLKILTAVFFFVLSPVVCAFDQIIFFGDSLSDDGNLYRSVFKFLPKSPPYYEGRFSNGPVWSERVGAYYALKRGVKASNYAVGGETAVFSNRIYDFIPYVLSTSIDSYLIRTVFRDRSTSLIVIWIGGNDYLFGGANVEERTQDVVDHIQAAIESLAYHGVKHFLLVNLPDLSRTPWAVSSGLSDNLKALSASHNIKIELMVNKLRDQYKEADINFFNAAVIFEDAMNNPEKYNQKYQLHIKNLTDSCWKGGYTLMRPNPDVIEAQLMQKIKQQTGAVNTHFNTKGFAEYVVSSPDLLTAYQVSEQAQSGVEPCENPSDYVFWDYIHPSASLHEILSGEIIELIDKLG